MKLIINNNITIYIIYIHYIYMYIYMYLCIYISLWKNHLLTFYYEGIKVDINEAWFRYSEVHVKQLYYFSLTIFNLITLKITVWKYLYFFVTSGFWIFDAGVRKMYLQDVF